LEAPTNVVLDRAWKNELEISWDNVTWAEIYTISYWKISAWAGIYEHEREIVVNETKTTIKKLEADTKYFIGVNAYDEDENESVYSEEVSFSTLDEASELKINNLKVIDTKHLNLEFNVELNEDFLTDTNIVNLWNDLEDIEVKKYDISGNKLDIFLTDDLKDKGKYSITIVNLEWKLGEKIESWVDGIIYFDVIKDVTKKEEIIELNSAENKDNNSKNTVKNKILGWKDIDIKSSKTLEGIAKNKKALPVTGPSETFLFILLSLIIWSLLFGMRRKVDA
jgi:hypothetical protein